MASVNKAILLGNLGQAPELKHTQGGAAFCKLSVATNRKYKQNDEWQQETTWHTVITWNKTAESCAQYLAKGSQVYVEGRIQTRKWQDKEGQDRWTTEVVAESVVFVGGGKGGGDRSALRNSEPEPQELPVRYEDDDLPF